MVLLVLLADQLVYLLHLHVVLLYARLERVLHLQCPLRVLDFVGRLRELVLFVVDGGLRLVFGVHGGQGGVGADGVGGGDAVVFESGLEYFPAPLFFEELLPGLVAESDEAMDAF